MPQRPTQSIQVSRRLAKVAIVVVGALISAGFATANPADDDLNTAPDSSTVTTTTELPSQTTTDTALPSTTTLVDAHVATTEPLPSDADLDKVQDNLAADLATAAETDLIDVIVQVDDIGAIEGLEETVGTVAEADTFDSIESFAAKLTVEQIAELAANPAVEQIEADEILSANNGSAGGSIGATQLRVSAGVTGDRDGNETSYSKTDVVIAVLDTGIDANHVDLDGGKVIGFLDLVNGQTTPYDDHGHGTHVAASAAGTGDGNAAHIGIAPGAALIGVKVLNAAGNGSSSTVITALQWAVTNKATFGIDVVNLSLGGVGCSNGTDSVSNAVNAAVNAGLVVVVAAGNEGPAACTISSPAAAANAITVGSVSDSGATGSFAAASYSSQGPTADGRLKPEISMPGTSVTSAQANSASSYTTYSGTSMATGIASGVTALLLDANPAASPAAIKSTLMATAQDFGQAGADWTFGSGVANAFAAASSISGVNYGSFALPAHGSLSGTLANGQSLRVPITVTDPSRGIGLTITHLDVQGASAASPDVDITLRQNGLIKLNAESQSRLEAATVSLSQAGTYELEIRAYAGPARFLLDVSGGVAIAGSPNPAGLGAANRADTVASLTWSQSPDPNVVAYSVVSAAGTHLTVEAASSSATVSGLAGSASYDFQIVAQTLGATAASNTVTAGPTAIPNLAFTEGTYDSLIQQNPWTASGPVNVVLGFSQAENAELLRAAQQLKMTPEVLQITGVWVGAFLLGLAPKWFVHPPVRPAPAVRGDHLYVVPWTSQQRVALDKMSAAWSLTPQETQKGGSILLIFLAALARAGR